MLLIANPSSLSDDDQTSQLYAPNCLDKLAIHPVFFVCPQIRVQLNSQIEKSASFSIFELIGQAYGLSKIVSQRV